MRRFLGTMTAAMVLCGGCSWIHHETNDGSSLPPAANGRPPTNEQLVQHLNQQANAIRSLEFDRVAIEAKQGLQQFGVDGNLAYEKPRNFRMMAMGPLGSSEADVGSNDQEFWFWFKRNDPPALFHCSYQDFGRVRELKLPIHPDWIAEAMCVNDLGPAAQYQMRQNGQILELHNQTTTPQGQQLEKVIRVANAGPNAGRIVGYQLKTTQGQELWGADIKEYKNVSGFWIPHKVTLRCPAEKLTLDFTLNKGRVNTLVAANSHETFTRPQMKDDIDLARGRMSTQSIQRVRGTSP